MPKLHPLAGLAALLIALAPAHAEEAADPQIEGPVRCAAVYTFFSVFIGKENPAAKEALTDAAVRLLEHASDIPPGNDQLVRERFKANNDALLVSLTDSTTGKAAREALGEELKTCGDTEKQIFGSSVRERLNP